MKTFALLGNPNSGKTTLFNTLTGSTARVGNWPGVTVDKREGYYGKGDNTISIIDLPGVYSLNPYTSEEEITLEYLLKEKPDCVINVVDSTNIERNLYLTTQIIETDIPVVVALNMYDVAKKRGDRINADKLSERFGTPFVFTSALKKEGIDELVSKAISASENKRKGRSFIKNNRVIDLIKRRQNELAETQRENSLFYAVKFVDDLYDCSKNDDEIDYSAIIADERYKYIESVLTEAYFKNRETNEKNAVTQKIDRILTNKYLGFPLFALILFLIFHFTFSDNLFWLGFVIKDKVALKGTAVEGLFGTNGLASIGVIMKNGVKILSSIARKSTEAALLDHGLANWAIGLISDGILGGIFSVFSFLPQILLLFAFFSVLEDSGYMARIAFILDKPLRKFQLTGRAFLPMIMGFGCSVPAMINTRTLSDEKEKLAAIRVIPFFYCGAKLPVLTAFSGAISGSFGVKNTDLITYGIYLLGVLTAMITVFVMRKTTLKSSLPPFIMELPDYRIPSVKNTAKLLWDKAKHFFKKAFSVILASTIIIWAISHFSFGFEYLDDSKMNQSILSAIGKIIAPLFTPLGFGSNLDNYAWIFAISVLTGLIAKENVIATIGTLSCCIASLSSPDANAIEILISSSGITIPAIIAFITFNMLTVPCVAAVATAKGEIRNKKYFYGTIAFWLTTSYAVSAIIGTVGQFWWSIFIFSGILVIGIVALSFAKEIEFHKFFVRRKTKNK